MVLNDFQNTCKLNRKYFHWAALLVENNQQFIYRKNLVNIGRLSGRLTFISKSRDQDKVLKTRNLPTVPGELTCHH